MAFAAGDQYQLATLDGEGDWTEWVRGFGYQPLVFGQRVNSLKHGKFGLQAIFRAAKWVRKNRIETVYVCGLRAAFAMRVFKRLFGGAMLVEGVRWNPSSDGRVDRAFRLVERYFGGRIDGYIANSAVTVRTLVDACNTPAEKTAVAHNGINPPDGPPIPWLERDPTVITIANYAPRKGYLEYLEAVRKVIGEYPTARFVLVGRDDMNGALQQEIMRQQLDAHVTCLGFIDHVGSLLARSRVFVLPSLWGEGCPTAILEAMAHNVPVVAYHLDGIPELVEHGKDGYLAHLGNSDELAKFILDILQSPDTATAMGEAGAKKILESFSISACVMKHDAAFNKFKHL